MEDEDRVEKKYEELKDEYNEGEDVPLQSTEIWTTVECQNCEYSNNSIECDGCGREHTENYDEIYCVDGEHYCDEDCYDDWLWREALMIVNREREAEKKELEEDKEQ